MSDIKFWDGTNWIDPCDTDVKVWTGSEWQKLKHGDAVWTGSEWREIVCTPTLNPFDFAVIRYKWESEAGKDLDTLTGSPDIEGYENSEVGYYTRIVNIPDTAPY